MAVKVTPMPKGQRTGADYVKAAMAAKTAKSSPSSNGSPNLSAAQHKGAADAKTTMGGYSGLTAGQQARLGERKQRFEAMHNPGSSGISRHAHLTAVAKAQQKGYQAGMAASASSASAPPKKSAPSLRSRVASAVRSKFGGSKKAVPVKKTRSAGSKRAAHPMKIGPSKYAGNNAATLRKMTGAS